MSELSISDLMKRQHELYMKHKDDWGLRVPAFGKDSILWMVDEIGEVIAIIKKKGADAIMEDEHVRAHYLEECSDVLMYYLDMLECFGISAEELTDAFDKKWKSNMGRTWEENYAMYED